ncbi:hypothetical protein TNIN_473581 [Trichonephila inaurata madagascariensis]|uniref:Uncharacterized protein n=1 Tax=Trichonephila inaurata madagascariensis TaxID=2747483 RepID=A0A8X6XYS0_9ARAC|nr:hypothetical protein TNIN_473581 [Trichonephila inaurata madagascariensis]
MFEIPLREHEDIVNISHTYRYPIRKYFRGCFFSCIKPNLFLLPQFDAVHRKIGRTTDVEDILETLVNQLIRSTRVELWAEALVCHNPRAGECWVKCWYLFSLIQVIDAEYSGELCQMAFTEGFSTTRFNCKSFFFSSDSSIAWDHIYSFNFPRGQQCFSFNFWNLQQYVLRLYLLSETF